MQIRDHYSALACRTPGTETASGAPSGDDFGCDPAHAGAGQADGARGAGGEVEHAAADEWATIIDGDNDAAATMADTELGAERQTTVGRGHCVLVETLAGRGAAAGLVAVKGSHSREGVATGRRSDRGISVTPGRTLGPGMMVVVMTVMMMVVPGFRGSFGDTATDQESCGDKSERRARPGYIPQRRLLRILHY